MGSALRRHSCYHCSRAFVTTLLHPTLLFLQAGQSGILQKRLAEGETFCASSFSLVALEETVSISLQAPLQPGQPGGAAGGGLGLFMLAAGDDSAVDAGAAGGGLLLRLTGPGVVYISGTHLGSSRSATSTRGQRHQHRDAVGAHPIVMVLRVVATVSLFMLLATFMLRVFMLGIDLHELEL